MDGKGRRERNGDGDRRRDDNSMVMDSGVQRRWMKQGQLNGDGWRNDNSTVMDSGARRRWMERVQLNGNERRVGDTRTMDDEEGTSTTAISTRPTMEATKASVASRH